MEILRKYGVQATFYFPLIERGVLDFNDDPAVFAAGDTKISKDGGAFNNTDNNPSHEGNGVYSLVLTATEMQAALNVVTIIDQTNPKAWEDQALVVSTYGDASAQHAFDLDTATVNLSAATEAQIDAIETDTNELQTDDVPGLIAALNDPSVADIADGVWDEAIAGHAGAGSTGEALSDANCMGVGAITFTYTLTSDVDGSPIADADVWVTSDIAGLFTIASGRTDQFGKVIFYLDAGTVYVWRQKTGWNFTNPDAEVVA